MAHNLADRSIDPRNRVGCLVVNEKNTKILALGYNGDQKGGPNSVEKNEPGQTGFIHAEENALIKLDFDYPHGKIMYITCSPCEMCAKKIINAEIDEVIYDRKYRLLEGLELLEAAGIKVRQYIR